MRTRRFFLENEAGARIPLNGQGGIWFNAIAGLGFEDNADFADMGNGFFKKRNNTKLPQSSITGELTFIGKHPYQDYNDFVNWTRKASELYLVYAPAVTEFVRPVTIQYLTKTELNKVGWLVVPVSFPALAPWYHPTVTETAIEKQDEDILYFDDEETVIDEATLSKNTYAGSLVYISPKGHIPGAFRLEYSGGIKNPVITLTGMTSNKEYGRCSLSTDFEAGEMLVLDTRIQEGGVWKQTNSALLDLTEELDLSFEPFPAVPMTENCMLKISGDGDVTGSASVKIYHYYHTV